MPFLEIASMIARELLRAIFFNYLFLPIFVAIVLLIKIQYDRYLEFQRNIYGKTRKTVREMLEESIFSGLITGFLGSFIIVAIGVPMSAEGFQYLFLIIAILVFVNIRYLCFSYAGGILALINLVFGFPRVDVPSLLALVAVMHLVESILIFFNAGKDSIPIFIRHKDGIAGAFLTRQYWPIPIVLLTFVNAGGGSGIVMPDWWPLLKPDAFFTGSLMLGLNCAVAVLGYSDISITRQPEKRSRETSLMLFCYSALLLLMAFLSTRMPVFKIVGALFAIAAHEGIIVCGYYHEKHGEPMFKPVKRGLKVLDTFPESHAEKMGIQRGDIILNINGKDIQTEEGLNEALKSFPTYLWIRVVNAEGKEKTFEYKCYPGGLNQLGILSVPREREVTYNIDYFESLGIIKNLVSRFRGANKSF